MLRPSEKYLFLVMAFVGGGFVGDQVEPVSVLISRGHSRAMPGGTGNVKCARPGQRPRRRGFSSLWR